MSVNPRKPGEQQLEQLEQAELEAQQQVDDAAAAAEEEARNSGASKEEITKAVQKARQEEKDKLYPQLSALKDSIKEIQETLRAEREEKERIKQEAEEAEERRRLAKLSDSDRHTEALTRIEEQLRNEREERLALQRSIAEEAKKASIEKYRTQALKEAGDEIIEDLVRGNTEAEIDASIENAKARYVELAERFKAESGAKTRNGMPRPTNPNTAALEEQELSEQLTAVDTDRLLRDPKYKEQIMAEMARAYNGEGY